MFSTTRSTNIVPKQLNYDWTLRGIRWRALLRNQHWGGLLLLIPAVIITGVARFTFQKAPTVRQALLYDATISYPIREQQTIPNSQASAFNWIALLVAVLVVELGVFWRQHSMTTALAGIVHQVWCCLVNFMIVVAVTEVTKSFSGSLRPDFLARCQPAHSDGTPPGNAADPLGGQIGAITLGEFARCTNTNADLIKDGRLSFPSGHASTSMSVAWFTVLYLVWSLYLRSDAPYPRRLYWGASFRARLTGEVLHALAYGFIVLCLCLSWFTGATRFWDNRHSIADIMGGFIVALIFTLPFFLKSVGLHTAMAERIDGDLNTKTAVLSPAGPEQPGTPNHANAANGAAATHIGQPPLLPVAAPAPHPAAGQWQAVQTPNGWQGETVLPHGTDGHASQHAGHGRPAVTGSSGDAVLEMPRR